MPYESPGRWNQFDSHGRYHGKYEHELLGSRSTLEEPKLAESDVVRNVAK